ncbi:LysM peptidoglycan-binding domain-containing protein [Kineococcus gypseus]|uniref:LysM peptidoglycan-binding domain-containing protein n=1 Tax=Kineococcus gypseus TaxID=1637102 RepID=UPI003D7ECFB5
MPATRDAARTTAVLATGAALAVLPAGAAAGLVALAAPSAASAARGTAALTDLLVASCGALGAALLALLAISVLRATAAEARERAAATRRPPTTRAARAARAARPVHPLVRRGVALAVGLVLGGGAVSTASAAARPPAPDAAWVAGAPLEPAAPAAAGDPLPAAPDPAWAPPVPAPVPELPRAELPGGTRTAPPGRDAGAGLVVQRGDSLWSLAQARSGAGASTAEVLHEQQRLYAANADVIGDDPDLLLPGQVLRLP